MENVLTEVSVLDVRDKKFDFIDLWDLDNGNTAALLQDRKTSEIYVRIKHTWYKSKSGLYSDINKGIGEIGAK